MTTISLGLPSRTASNDLPEDLGAGHATLLFGLSPGGVCHARTVSCPAVSSCLAFSPLPSSDEPTGRRYIFCGTFPVRQRTVGVTHHPALWSPDFPPTLRRRSPRGPDPGSVAVVRERARVSCSGSGSGSPGLPHCPRVSCGDSPSTPRAGRGLRRWCIARRRSPPGSRAARARVARSPMCAGRVDPTRPWKSAVGRPTRSRFDALARVRRSPERSPCRSGRRGSVGVLRSIP